MTTTIPNQNIERLLLPYVNLCYSVALTLTGNPHHAQYLIHRVLHQALNAPEITEPDANLKAWLLQHLRETYQENRYPASGFSGYPAHRQEPRFFSQIQIAKTDLNNDNHRTHNAMVHLVTSNDL